MKKNFLPIITQNPGFLGDSFAKDILKFELLEDTIVTEIVAWIEKINELSELTSNDELVEISQKGHISIDQLREAVDSLVWLCSVCNTENVQIIEFIDYLDESNVFSKAINKPIFLNQLKTIAKALVIILSKLEEKLCPSLPLLRIEKFRTRVIFISDFGKSFNIKNDNVNDYIPILQRIHPRVLIELSFYEKDKEYPILLDESGIDSIIKRLQLTKIELNAATKFVKMDK